MDVMSIDIGLCLFILSSDNGCRNKKLLRSITRSTRIKSTPVLPGKQRLCVFSRAISCKWAKGQDRREGGVTRVVTRGPRALRGPVENKVCIFGYDLF